MKALALIFLILVGESVWAQSSARMLSRTGEFKAKKLGVTMQNYTGPAYTSFSDGSSGYGGEISTDAGGKHLRYFFRARFNRAQGRQDFKKSSTIYNSRYDFMSFEPELGISLYPVARNERGLNIYLWGSGHLSYNYLELMNIPSTVTGVDPKSQDFGSGYGGGVGLEFVIGGSKTAGKFMLYGELGFRENFAPLAGANSFEISGMTASLGFGF